MDIRQTSFEDPMLQAAWQELYNADDLATGTYFQSYEWNRTWWEFYGKPASNHSLLLLLLTEGSRITAIAPLYSGTRSMLNLPLWRRIRWIGDALPPYPDILVRSMHASEAWRAIFDYIGARYPSAWLELGGALSSGSLDGISDAAYERRTQPDDVYHWVDIPVRAGDDSWFTAGLSKTLRRYRASGSITWEFSQRVLRTELLGHMISYNTSTFGAKSYFASAQNEAFFSALAERDASKTWYSTLSFEGVPVSVMFGFRRRDVLYFFLSGTTHAFPDPNVRLGGLNRYLLFKHMQESGIRRFDFLRGDDAYKLEYRPETMYSKTCTFIPHRKTGYYAATALRKLRKLAG